jgi:hypothetical protein
MDSFTSSVVDALVGIGIDASSAKMQAYRAVCEIEQTMEDEETLTELFEKIGINLREACEAVVGTRIDRMLIAPIPRYLEPFLPQLIEAIPEVVLADNFRVGQIICGYRCVSLPDALATPYDAYFLGTFMGHLAKFFRDQFPIAKTIDTWALRRHAHTTGDAVRTPQSAKLLAQVNSAQSPIIFLTAYLDATLIPTMLALQDRGWEVIVVVRRPLKVSAVALQDTIVLKKLSIFRLSFHETLDLLENNVSAPVIVNYQRFFASNWDIKNTIFLFAYSIAILNATKSKKILHLYDIYNVCTHGFEWAGKASHLYYQMLVTADAILVNSETFGVFEEFESSGKPILSFLRYAPKVEPSPRVADDGIHIVCITGFLGEHNDITRATSRAILSILRRGFHVHYYADSMTSKEFHGGLAVDYQDKFHLHAPISDQAALVREISQYDAGWLGIDIRPVTGLEKYFSSVFGKKLASVFPISTCATAALYYGAAGLPAFVTEGTYPLQLFGQDGGLPVRLTADGDIADQELTFGKIDLPAAKRQVKRERFVIDNHIEKLDRWLKRFSTSDLRTNRP